MSNIFTEPMFYKDQLSNIKYKCSTFVAIFDGLYSKPFRDLISRVFGIGDLLQDEILPSGGLY
jgi:hypothetical protein